MKMMLDRLALVHGNNCFSAKLYLYQRVSNVKQTFLNKDRITLFLTNFEQILQPGKVNYSIHCTFILQMT